MRTETKLVWDQNMAGQYLEGANKSALQTAKVIEKEAKRLARKGKTGKLEKGIKAKKSKFKDGGAVVLATAPHSHLIEYGHQLVKKGGMVIGHVPAYPFLRPALEKTGRKAKVIFAKNLKMVGK